MAQSQPQVLSRITSISAFAVLATLMVPQSASATDMEAGNDPKFILTTEAEDFTPGEVIDFRLEADPDLTNLTYWAAGNVLGFDISDDFSGGYRVIGLSNTYEAITDTIVVNYDDSLRAEGVIVYSVQIPETLGQSSPWITDKSLTFSWGAQGYTSEEAYEPPRDQTAQELIDSNAVTLELTGAEDEDSLPTSEPVPDETTPEDEGSFPTSEPVPDETTPEDEGSFPTSEPVPDETTPEDEGSLPTNEPVPDETRAESHLEASSQVPSSPAPTEAGPNETHDLAEKEAPDSTSDASGAEAEASGESSTRDNGRNLADTGITLTPVLIGAALLVALGAWILVFTKRSGRFVGRD